MGGHGAVTPGAAICPPTRGGDRRRRHTSGRGTVPAGRKAVVLPVRNSYSELAVVPPNTEEWA